MLSCWTLKNILHSKLEEQKQVLKPTDNMSCFFEDNWTGHMPTQNHDPKFQSLTPEQQQDSEVQGFIPTDATSHYKSVWPIKLEPGNWAKPQTVTWGLRILNKGRLGLKQLANSMKVWLQYLGLAEKGYKLLCRAAIFQSFFEPIPRTFKKLSKKNFQWKLIVCYCMRFNQ